MGLAAVSPVRGAGTASTRNGASRRRTRFGDSGFARSVHCACSGGAVEVEAFTKSVSPTVETERLLDEEGNWGAEKVLDAAETYESWESGSSRLYSAGMGAGWAKLRFSAVVVVSVRRSWLAWAAVDIRAITPPVCAVAIERYLHSKRNAFGYGSRVLGESCGGQ
jgi:hypothetical protein